MRTKIVFEHLVLLSEEELLSQCRLWRTRRTGPGGQHRNKVETAVVIEHLDTGIRGEASERRRQVENRRVALLRLQVNLAIAVPGTWRGDCLMSPTWAKRCAGGYIRVSARHADYPALLAEAMTVIGEVGLEMKQAADRLEVTTSQLLKFVKTQPRAWASLNGRRREIGLSTFK